MKPSRRKEMAKRAVDEKGLSIRKACQIFSISKTCYRYQAKLSDDNALRLLLHPATNGGITPPLNDEQHDRLWGEISEQELIELCSSADIIPSGETDEVSGQSDEFYQVEVEDVGKFKEELREVIMGFSYEEFDDRLAGLETDIVKR